MSIIDKLISSIVPHVCLGCGYESVLICADCIKSIEVIPPRCYRCRRSSPGFRVCDGCRSVSNLHAVYVAIEYDGLAKDLLWRLKSQSVQAAAGSMAELMAPLVASARDAWLVPVPTATKRARSRGYDQAKLLARELSRRTRLPYVDCLRRSGQTHQVGASRNMRLQQLQDSFWVSGSINPNQQIILVDDVVTTGATLEAAGTAFKKTGIEHMSALAFAQPEVLEHSMTK